ncbi:MAG: transglutaminase-like domain-containing protein [Sneathiellaceae bacterium]
MEPEEALAALRRIGQRPDDEIDLIEAALLLAVRDRPQVALDRYHAYVDELADTLTAKVAAGQDAAVTALIRTLADDHGYRGDQRTYDDPQNANLIRVIDRRRGLPVSLGILYIGVARRAGLQACGLNFPSHFLIAVDADGTREVIDPFHHGRRLNAGQMRHLVRTLAQAPDLKPEFYAPVGNRDVLLRLQNNVKIRAVQSEQPQRAIQTLEAMVALAPDHGESWRELGVLRAHVGELLGGIDALERSLSLHGDDGERHRIAILLQQLRGSMN